MSARLLGIFTGKWLTSRIHSRLKTLVEATVATSVTDLLADFAAPVELTTKRAGMPVDDRAMEEGLAAVTRSDAVVMQ